MGRILERSIYNATIGALVGALSFSVGWLVPRVYDIQSNYIPKVERIQDGYVIPERLKIRVIDEDKNGDNEVILKYKGKMYLLKDIDGKPIISEFQIKNNS